MQTRHKLIGFVAVVVTAVASIMFALPSSAAKQSKQFRVLPAAELSTPVAVEVFLNEIAEKGYVPVDLNVTSFTFREGGTGKSDAPWYFRISTSNSTILIVRRL